MEVQQQPGRGTAAVQRVPDRPAPGLPPLPLRPRPLSRGRLHPEGLRLQALHAAPGRRCAPRLRPDRTGRGGRPVARQALGGIPHGRRHGRVPPAGGLRADGEDQLPQDRHPHPQHPRRPLHRPRQAPVRPARRPPQVRGGAAQRVPAGGGGVGGGAGLTSGRLP
ncbi:hypothetical protein SGPA1_11680 [Streptomyces misionensis JCM 4497]